MTNQPTNPEEKCNICKGYEFFKHLLHDSELNMEEAFHEAIGFVLDTTLDEVVEEIEEEAYGDGFQAGSIRAYRQLAKDLNGIADNIESMSDVCCECCDCEDECNK